MKFNVVGEKGNPIVVMLTGSFCPGESLEYIYSRLKDYYIVVPTYNGHHEGGKDFTTREGEAREIREYLTNLGIEHIHMIYGQSMGSEIGMELYRQLSSARITVDKMFFDGAPMIRWSAIHKAFMRFKFSTMINIFRNKTIDEAMNMKFLKQFVGDKINSLKPMIESLITIAPYLTNNSIKNVAECCYTFDFPRLDNEMQKHTYFFYGDQEKAYKICYQLVQKAYPKANYRVEKGHGHMTYSCEHTEDYVTWLQDIMRRTS